MAASYIPGESTVMAFSARHFGAVSSPYVSAYVYRTGNVDRDFGMRRDADGSFRIGNAEVVIDQDSKVFVKGKSLTGTRGLFELLTRKKVDQSFITRRDLQSYREFLEERHGHLENNDPAGVIKTTRVAKFKEVSPKLFPTAVLQDAVHRVISGNRDSIFKFVKNKIIARRGTRTHKSPSRERTLNHSASLAIVI